MEIRRYDNSFIIKLQVSCIHHPYSPPKLVKRSAGGTPGTALCDNRGVGVCISSKVRQPSPPLEGWSKTGVG